MKNKIARILNKILIFILRKSNKLHLNIINKHNLNKSKYQFLIPFDKADKNEKYSQALNDALKNEKVKNIAISGSYGSGKSSFIKTFEVNNPQWNFLDISLATFNKPQTDISIVEKSILQQMFYKVETKDIPQSRFKKINAINFLKSKSIFLLIYILSIFIFIDMNLIKNLFFPKDLMFIPLLIILYGSYHIIKTLIQNYRGITLDKMNLQSLEISTNKDEESSLLNKYLDEILYFFEKTNFNIIVFQDLDRFENLEIFTKLRELNNFINNSNQVNKRVIFLYAIKDDMFSDTQNNRTKFFDFIIPIIPYINPSSSYDKLLVFFKKEIKKNKIDKNFLSDISLYIEDMRLLKNIYNEFKIYDKKIGNRLNKTKLLAMVVYKNFYPNDFSKLHKSQGLVFTVFNDKLKYIQTLKNTFNNKINTIKDEIKLIEKEPQSTIIELRMIYICKIIEKLGQIQNNIFYCDNQQVLISEAIKDDKFTIIKNSSKIQTQNYNGYKIGNINFTQIENEINTNQSYQNRENIIINKTNSKIAILQSSIDDIYKQINSINAYSIQTICIKELGTNLFNEDFKDKELLKYLIINAYIDEDYYLYISHSFNKSITPNDTKFLKNAINNYQVINVEYKLNNIEELVNKLRIEHFSKSAILNFDIVKYINKNKEKYPNEFEVLFNQLSKDVDLTNHFIFKYIDRILDDNTFIKNIAEKWLNIWKYIYTNIDFTNESKENYFYKILYQLNSDDIIKLNVDNTLYNFISNLTILRDLVKEDNIKFKNIIKILNIKFDNLTKPISNTPLFSYIYENDNYVLNQLMIEQIALSKYAPKKEIKEDLEVAHLTSIKELDYLDKVLVKIKSSINEYIKNVFLKIDSNTQESEETIIELINNEELEEHLKSEILKKQEIKIKNINSITQHELWYLLFKENKIISTWDNILHYYKNKENKIESQLIDYLNIENNYKELSKFKINNENDFDKDTTLSNFNKELMLSNDINDNAYEYLIKSIWFWKYPTLAIQDLNSKKVDLMIESTKFELNQNNINSIKEHFPPKHIALIEGNIDDYIENFDKFDTDTNDIIKLLKSQKISIKIKKEIIEKIDYELINTNEIAKLIYSIINKKIIRAISYTQNMISNLESLESKVNIIVEQQEEFANEELIEMLELLPSEYNKICRLDGKQTVILSTDYNKRLIELLYDREFITSDKSEKNKKIRLFIKNKVDNE